MTSPVVGNPTVYQITAQTVQISPASGKGSSCLIYNADPVAVAYVGTNRNLTPYNATAVQPLTYAVVDNSQTLYAVAPAAAPTVLLNVTPGGTYQSPSPAQAAAQIAAAGIPSVDNPTALNGSPVFNQTIAAGATYTSPRMTVKQFQSWFGKFFATATSSGLGTNPFTQWEMQWSVASDGYDPLRTEDWSIPNTPYNFLYNYINQGQGSVIGDTLTLAVTNLDTQPVNLTYGLFGSYRSRARSVIRGQYQWNAGTGAPDPTRGLVTDDIVWINGDLPAIGIGGQYPPGAGYVLMNLWDGPISISGNLQAGANGLQVVITPLPVSALGLFPVIGGYVLNADAAGVIHPSSLILPRRVCGITVLNGSGMATNAGGVLVVTGQAQPE